MRAATGHFLQTDPIPGGSANAYDYANQDPINQYDLDGRGGRGGGKLQPERLTKDEQDAIDNKNAGRPYNQRAYNRGREKEIYNEKARSQNRNKQKRQSNFSVSGTDAAAGGALVLTAALLIFAPEFLPILVFAF